MSKSSINFKIVKSNSEAHNERKSELDYTFPELSKNNESAVIESIDSRVKKIEKICKELSGRKLQKNAAPIREAVVNLNANHTLEDVKTLSREINRSKGIGCFQIHLHRDEGKSRSELNYHAHMLFDWQDKETGKTIKLNRQDLSEIQDLVAKHLGMERGELRENSNRQRLEPIEYKRQQEEKRVAELQSTVKDLEQKKKNIVKRHQQHLEEFRKAEKEYGGLEELSRVQKTYQVLKSRIEEREGKSYKDFLEERRRKKQGI